MRVLADFPMADRREMELPDDLVRTGLVVFMRPPNQVPREFNSDRSRAQQNKWYLRRTDELYVKMTEDGMAFMEVWRAE